MGKYLHYTIAFAAGAIIMTLEVLGFRLLAPHFGYSVYVFGSLIGVVLAALALGYWIGGILADRNGAQRTVGFLLLAASCYLALGVWISRTLLLILADAGIIAGTLGAAAFLLLPPLTALAILSPYLVRLRAVNEGKPIGVSAGSIAAWGTLGSIAGTFVGSFYFIPELGTRATFIIAVFATATTALPFLAPKRLWLFVLVPLVAVLGTSSAPTDPRVVHGRESLYSALEVVDYGDFLGLRTERRSGTVQTFIAKPGEVRRFLLYDLFALPPLLTGGRRALLLGLAGGSIPRVHANFGQTVETVGVELDPDVIELGKRYFHLDELQNLSVHIGDARPFVAENREMFDIVEIDLFGGGVDIPFYTTTQEFFLAVADRLRPGGAAAINVYDPSSNRILVEPIANTMAAVFSSVTLIDAGYGSYFVMASMQPLSLADRPEASSELRKLLTYARDHAETVAFDAGALVLTDDRAPVEQLTYGAFERLR